MLPPQQLGWMAGVLDTKGRVLAKTNQQRASRQLVLAVDSTDMTIIRRLSSMVGTSPEMKPPKQFERTGWLRRGCLEHCPEAHVHVLEDPYVGLPVSARWTVTGSSMAVVVYNVLPYLSRTEEFETAMIEVLTTGPASGSRGWQAVLVSLQRLVSLGWELPTTYASEIQQTRQIEAA